MRRVIALALSAMLAGAGLARAQSDSPYANAASGQTRTLRTGPLAPALGGSDFQEDFRPLAFIQRQYLAVLGREATEEEAKYWLIRMQYESRRDIARQIRMRPPTYGVGHYDPALGQDYDPGYGSRFFPDPASRSFRDPSGPYFKSPYYPNYQYRGPIRAFYLGEQG
jgi:hypothetical protein